jgi:hypothetical protein
MKLVPLLEDYMISYVGGDDFDDDGLNLLDQIEDFQTTNKDIYISRNKEPLAVALNDEDIVVGVVYTHADSDVFEFDVMVDVDHRGNQIADMLIRAAIGEYKDMKSGPYPDIEMNVDIVSPAMEHILRTKFGFTTEDDGDGTWTGTLPGSR